MAAPPYELIYYTGAPGRGEHVRLTLEEAGATYTDGQSLPMDECRYNVFTSLDKRGPGEEGNPPYYAPPLLKHGNFIISQTPNILQYLGSKFGLGGSTETDKYHVNALAMTALDGLCTEVHDTHHPIAVELYYEDQKVESQRKSQEWIKNRLPKHLGYWEKVLKSRDQGPWLLGETFTYADIVLFHCLDGVQFSFPNATKQAKNSGEYNRVFKLWEDVKARPNIAAYLASDRRQKFSSGIFRHYPVNDLAE